MDEREAARKAEELKAEMDPEPTQMPPIEEVHIPLKDQRPQSYSLKSMLGWKQDTSGNLIDTMKQWQQEIEHLGWKNFIDVSDDTQRL